MTLDTIEATDARPSELVGSAIQRREDPHLIAGDAEYTDDIAYPNQVYLALLGSQHAHARIEAIETGDAAAVEDVVAVYTQADVEASGIDGTLRVDDVDGGVTPDNPFLARETVTYQGQPVAAVVATDRYAAHDALDAIDVTYEPLDPVVDPVEAVSGDAPTIHDDAPDNTAFTWRVGDAGETDAAFDRADRVVDFDVEINRVLPVAMEPRGAIARYNASTGELAVEMSTQNPHAVRGDLADALDHPERKIRVRPPDVGGGFGAKLQPYAGHHLAAWAARELERPVKWVARRTEDCQAMAHSRHQVIEASAAVTDDGDLLGVRAQSTVPVGGYLAPGGAGVPMNFGRMVNGQYALPNAHVEIRGAFTNTTPLGAYRGAGRPEATYFIERLVSTVARDLDLDPVDVRRRNFVQPDEFPYETGFGRTYDSGDYEKTLDAALDAVDYEAFRAEQEELREDGRYVGLGLSCYVEACGAAPGWHEEGAVEVHPDGSVVVKSGTAEIGTGHRTAYTQIAANELGVDFDDIEVVEGDTDHVVDGGGTAGSRAMPIGGSAVRESASAVREKAAEIAAHLLEAAPEDVEPTGDGEFHVAGAPEQSVTMREIATAAYGTDLPDDIEPGLAATKYYDPPNYTFPFGTHVALVEVDPETGDVDLYRYHAVDDVGEQINPKIVEGQVHGGAVQGIGQALQEGVEYAPNGTLTTSSLQDYAVPKANQLPELETETTVTPCPHNPLGVKGVGEAGAIGAPPAVVNAVLDALQPLGVRELDMPLTNERVWQAIRDAD